MSSVMADCMSQEYTDMNFMYCREDDKGQLAHCMSCQQYRDDIARTLITLLRSKDYYRKQGIHTQYGRMQGDRAVYALLKWKK
ncbi:hypothetical protein NPIL_30151 [Nephila pilipes]|uniref:Uncharacterized protein n=1 Tax=Nephila pilipes TaxID=299642 RepID=A0A8X6MLR1_NEPPI|nr:hypothetical protein NPIL_30151 [Nephila pilipes]